MKTPLVKAKRLGVTHEFYSSKDFELWLAEQGNTCQSVKYFKGLGTSTRTEACDYFSRMKDLEVVFSVGEEGTAVIRWLAGIGLAL